MASDHAAYMREEGEWVYWPKLPVKRPRPGTIAEVGTMVPRRKDGTVVIFLTTIFQPLASDTPVLTYDSPEAAVADGWVVD